MPLTVDDSDILDGFFRARMDEVHTSVPGKVIAYYPATQTVDVKPTVKRVSYDENGDRADDELPVIPGVPVCWPRGGGFFISFPIAAGDHVLLVFSEGATGDWRASGNVTSPSDATRHGINGAFAIPGAAPDGQALANADATQIILGKDGTNLQIAINGSLITLGKGPSPDFVALATKVNQAISNLQSKYDTHTHTVTTTGANSAGTVSGTGTAAATTATAGPQASVAATLVKAV